MLTSRCLDFAPIASPTSSAEQHVLEALVQPVSCSALLWWRGEGCKHQVLLALVSCNMGLALGLLSHAAFKQTELPAWS